MMGMSCEVGTPFSTTMFVFVSSIGLSACGVAARTMSSGTIMTSPEPFDHHDVRRDRALGDEQVAGPRPVEIEDLALAEPRQPARRSTGRGLEPDVRHAVLVRDVSYAIPA